MFSKLKSRSFLGLIFSSILITVCHALYDSSSGVIELTPSNFESKVIDSEEIWIVEFFAPWCGHCQNLVPEYKKAAKALKGIVKVGAVNADEHQTLGSRFGVRGFPTIKIFGRNKKSPQDYQGGRTAQGFIDAAFRELRNLVDSRIGGGSKSGSSGGGSKSKDVIELTESNFDKQVLQSKDHWMVEFFAPWCGHCKKLAPVWAEVATELKGKVKVGAVDCTVHKSICDKYQVQGFPTIKYFPVDKNTDPEEYASNDRTKNGIVEFALERAEDYPEPEAIELTNGEEQLKEACENYPLCVISILPHILDCDSKCRNNYLEVVNQIAKKFKKNRWQFLWAEAMAQPDLEQALDIGGFGYPAMAVINGKKMKYSLLRGSFDSVGIGEFFRELSYGRGSSYAIRGGKFPKVTKSEPWDGKDGEIPKTEL